MRSKASCIFIFCKSKPTEGAKLHKTNVIYTISAVLALLVENAHILEPQLIK